MTPHPHPLDPARPVHRRGRGRRVRGVRGFRTASFAAVLVVASSAPLVAHASAGNTADAVLAARVGPGVVDSSRISTTRSTAAPAGPELEVLLDTYDWDERSPRVEELQRLIGASADGWYGVQTRAAHIAALDGLDLSTTGVPAIVLPRGPAPEKWEALRECEAGGDYSITSRSGKYRGAYQFDRSTWNSVASRYAPDLVGVDPAAAAPADQDAMANALYSERGARPWPHCGRHLR